MGANMADLRSQVGRLVRHHRERCGLTQAELAERIERSVQLIARIEGGRAAPSFETLDALAVAFAIPVRDLFGADAYFAGPGSPDPLDRLVHRVSALDPIDLDWVLKVVEIALSRKPPRKVT